MVRTSTITAAVVAASLSLALAATAQAAPRLKKCTLAGGEAYMATQDLAEFMANAALKNSINHMGAKPAGRIKLTCNPYGLLQYCKATRRACR